MKICYLDYYNPLSFHGGAERVILKEAELMAQGGNEVVIITTHNNKNIRSEKLRNGKIKVWFLPDMHLSNSSIALKLMNMVFSLHNPALVNQVKQILRIEKPEILHIHNPGAISISVVNAAKQLGCKVVQTFHGYNFECPKGSLYRKSNVMCSNPLPICKMYKQVFHRTAQKDDSIIAICSFVRERLLKAGYSAKKIALISNSLQDNYADPVHAKKAKNKEILLVGRMVKAKGAHVLIESLAKVKKACNQKFVVNLIGEGEDKTYFESQARALGVEVNFLGNISDTLLKKYYEEAYMVIVPSLFPELFPMVVLEAMSHGKPIIASNIGGLPDLVAHGQTGLLFEPNDENALANCITYLLTREELAADFGFNALKMSQKFFDNNHAKELLNLYKRILSQSRLPNNAKESLDQTSRWRESTSVRKKDVRKVEMTSWGINGFDSCPRSLAERLDLAHDLELMDKSVRELNLHSKQVLNAAGGRAKEAEFLIKKGCSEVIVGDIAPSQLLGAKRRKEKHELNNLELIRLDAEHLPFRLGAFDLVYVHMGLHHFPHPYHAISEFCQVTRDSMIFIDIMNPVITKVLVFLGLFKKEGCGVEPKRLEERKVKSALDKHGFQVNFQYFFMAPLDRRDDILSTAVELLNRSLNLVMCLANRLLGLLFGNVAIITGKKASSKGGL
jgi:glycosyltransferase involved in cell wall biosynthesis/ubiquinone/menaquinone biosynthesis C-methylase UbiE